MKFILIFVIYWFEYYIKILLTLPADVLSEDAILKWYKETHSSRGWSVFMDQMKKFVDWLEQAEEEGIWYYNSNNKVVRLNGII